MIAMVKVTLIMRVDDRNSKNDILAKLLTLKGLKHFVIDSVSELTTPIKKEE